MKQTGMASRRYKMLATAALLVLAGAGTVEAAPTIFVADRNNPGTIGEYTTSGETVNAALVSGLHYPFGVAVSGSHIFVGSTGSQAIGVYTTSGATVNAALVTGLTYPASIAVSGSHIFVANNGGNTIGEYTTAGATVNAALISGLHNPSGIAIEDADAGADAPEPASLAILTAG